MAELGKPAGEPLPLHAAVWVIAAATVGLHLITATGYGIFRDEMYYVVCSQRLDWGYVDQPPVSIVLLAIWRFIAGESLFALRVPPALVHGAVVVMFGLIAREVGARAFGQLFAALLAGLLPVYLGTASFYSMNCLDALFWALLVFILCRIIATGNAKLWLAFGVVAGLGLQNKFSVGFLGMALAVGVVLTQHRRWLLNPYVYAGSAIAVLLFLPHVIWMYSTDWITLEFMSNASKYKNSPTNPVKYFLDQALTCNPLFAPVWLAGIGYGLFAKAVRPYRLFAIMFVVLFFFFSLTRGKSYYLSPAYALVIPLGALAFERATATKARWARPLAFVLALAAGLALAPLAVPLLPVETALRFQTALGIGELKDEVGHDAALNQHFADRFGWHEFVEEVAMVYNALPEDERAKCTILCSNYGQAAAIDLFGRNLGLPYAISTHNNYWLWGPRNASPDILIAVDGAAELIMSKNLFESGKKVAQSTHPYSEEGVIEIFVFHSLKPPLTIDALWRTSKQMI